MRPILKVDVDEEAVDAMVVVKDEMDGAKTLAVVERKVTPLKPLSSFYLETAYSRSTSHN